MRPFDAHPLNSDTVWLTQMKGIAMIYIILFHWFSLHLSGVWKIAANMGAQGNHIFFILSAFGLSYALSKGKNSAKSLNWGAWLKRRIKKLMIPYYISVGIVFLSILAAGLFADSAVEVYRKMHFNWDTAFSTVFLYRNFIGSHTTAINTPWWFAITILQFYLIFPWLYSALEKKGWKWLAAGSFLVNTAYILFFAVILKSTNNAFNCFPLRFIFSFCLGLILCQAYLKDSGSIFRMLTGWKPVLIGLVLEGIGVFLSFQGDAGKAFNELFFGPGIFLLTLNFLKFLRKFRITFNLSQVVGDYSLPLFLLHAPYIFLIFPAKLPPGFVSGFLYFTAYAVFLVIMTWITSRFIFNKVGLPREKQFPPAVKDGKENTESLNGRLMGQPIS